MSALALEEVEGYHTALGVSFIAGTELNVIDRSYIFIIYLQLSSIDLQASAI